MELREDSLTLLFSCFQTPEASFSGVSSKPVVLVKTMGADAGSTLEARSVLTGQVRSARAGSGPRHPGAVTTVVLLGARPGRLSLRGTRAARTQMLPPVGTATRRVGSHEGRLDISELLCRPADRVLGG